MVNWEGKQKRAFGEVSVFGSSSNELVPKEIGVTVVLPTWNRVDRLAVSLPALLSQTSSDVRFIVLDNASTDGTEEFLKDAASRDPRLFLIQQPRNLGPVRNIVQGLRATATSHACIVSDDDLMFGAYIDFVARIVREHPSTGVIHHDFGVESSQARRPTCIQINASARAAYEAFRASGSISGLTIACAPWRSLFPGEPKWALYPQVEWSTKLALWLGYFHVKGAGFHEGPWRENTYSQMVIQGRGLDLGLRERVEISEEIPHTYLRAKAINNLAIWAKGAIQDLRTTGQDSALAEAVEGEIAELLSSRTPLFRSSGVSVVKKSWTYFAAGVDLIRRLAMHPVRIVQRARLRRL